jgi:DNA sulfur modification protein DndD
MLLRRLVLENFGLFRDRNELELTTRFRYRQRRPVVLIGGKNGSGKTTLLEALRLCLYGPLTHSGRMNTREYEQYLAERIHRADGLLLQPKSAAVGIEFEYAQAGQRQSYWVERRWDRHDSDIRSELTILRDGAPLDELDRAHADDFLRDLIPPGVSQLFFFDGERIQELAESDQDHLALAEATRGLIGLELLERLQADLRVYSAKAKDTPKADTGHAELTALAQNREALDLRLREATRLQDEHQAKLDRLRQTIALEKRRLSQAGGGFANQRESLEAEKELLEHAITDAEVEIRDLCEGLLPFVLASSLCQSLRRQLEDEGKLQQWEILKASMSGRLVDINKRLPRILFPNGERKDIPQEMRKRLTGRFSKLLNEILQPPKDLPELPLIHRVSEDDRIQLLSAIDRVLDDVPRQVKLIHKRLERSTRRLSEVAAALKKIPGDEIIQPVFERLNELHRELGAAQAELDRAELAVHEIELQLKDLVRRENKLQDRLAGLEKAGDQRALAARVQVALNDYAKVLATSKIHELSDAVVRCFTQLWRKGDLVRRIEINPGDFGVTLFDRHDRPVPKQQLSAGEKQIYAISVLWALAQVSGRPLPMVIDTPLGRLDSDHRGHLVERYFPNASHQVIILSTDTEIDQDYFRALSPSISHAYHLRFDEGEARCVIEKGYFWSGQEMEVAYASK